MEGVGFKWETGELTRDYIRSMRLLQNTSRWLHGGVG